MPEHTATVSHLAFVQSERLVSNSDAVRDLWVPFQGPHDPADATVRFAVFAWSVFDQEWRREVEFPDEADASAYALAVHRRTVQRLEIK